MISLPMCMHIDSMWWIPPQTAIVVANSSPTRRSSLLVTTEFCKAIGISIFINWNMICMMSLISLWPTSMTQSMQHLNDVLWSCSSHLLNRVIYRTLVHCTLDRKLERKCKAFRNRTFNYVFEGSSFTNWQIVVVMWFQRRDKVGITTTLSAR